MQRAHQGFPFEQYLIGVMLTLVLTACDLFLPDDEATWVLKDLAAGDEASQLKKTACPPYREIISYKVNGSHYQADLYSPGQTPLAAMVLSPGLAEAGKNDPRLVSFAQTLARARFMVLVPDLGNLRELKVRHEDVQGLIDAFKYLHNQDGINKTLPVGMGAFSYMAGPAILAATQHPQPEKVAFVLSVGGYFDLNEVIHFFTTGYFRVDDEWRYIEPNDYGKWAFVISNADLLDQQQDQHKLMQIAKRKMADPDADIDELRKNLSADGQAVVALMTNRDRKRSDELIAALPAAIKTQLAKLNLANKDLSRLKARLLLIHGTDDSIIPYNQSQQLAMALPQEQSQLFLVDGLAHVDIKPLELDRQQAWQAIKALLAQRKRPEEETGVCKSGSNRD